MRSCFPGSQEALNLTPILKIPPTAAEHAQAEAEKNQSSLNNYLVKPTSASNNEILKEILGLWIIRRALSWSGIKDPLFRDIFSCDWANVNLFGLKWVADKAKSIYLTLQQQILEELEVSLIPPIFRLSFLIPADDIHALQLRSRQYQESLLWLKMSGHWKETFMVSFKWLHSLSTEPVGASGATWHWIW